MEQFCTQLLGSILFKKCSGFRRKTDRTGTAGFGWPYINTLILGVQKRLLDHHDAFVQINSVPLKTHQLASAATGIDENVGHDLPLERCRFQRFEDCCHLFRLEVVCFLLRGFGRGGLGSRVVGNQQLLIRLRHDHGDQPVMLQNGFIR